MKKVERPAASKAIAEAREKGDLKENAEYDAAKEAQGMLEAKIKYLEERLTFDQQRRLDAGKIRRKIIRLQTHEASESDFPVDSIAECYPTRVGRKVS